MQMPVNTLNRPTLLTRRQALAAALCALLWLSGLASCDGAGSTSTEPSTSTTGVPPVTVSLAGKIDAGGVLLQDVEIASFDGVAVLKLAKGTKALDASGKPLGVVTVTPARPETPWYTFSLYNLVYEFQPAWSHLRPAGNAHLQL